MSVSWNVDLEEKKMTGTSDGGTDLNEFSYT